MIKVKLYKTTMRIQYYLKWVDILMKSTSTTLLDGDPEKIQEV